MDCLESIISKTKHKNVLNSYKAGSWGLQPFDVLYKEFEERGLKLVFGPIKGLKVPALDLDYSGMESEDTPYYCDANDITKIGQEKGIVVVPMTPTHLNWIDFIKYVFHLKTKGLKKKYDADLDVSGVPEKVKTLKPLSGKDKLNISLKPFKTHLKINAHPYWYLKNTFKRSYKNVIKSDNDFKLIIIETHTKDFKNNFQDIDKFFTYVRKKYSNIKFIKSSELINHLQEDNLKAKLRA